MPVHWTIAGPLQLREGQGGWKSESGTSDGDSKAPRIEGAEAGVGKGSTTCSASAMVLLFASIPEGLERRSRMLDFTHSRGRSRTVATTRECMAFKRSWVRLPSPPSCHGPRVLGCESVAAVATTPPFSAPRGDLAASPCSLAGMVATSSMRSGTGRRARVARAMQGRRRRRGARGAPPVRGGA